MVYVYFVQPGCMMTFDNEISIMQSVEDLKDKIEEKLNIPKDQQVLLISGGESLDCKKNLCSYMAGTDTNPIFLFSTGYNSNDLDILKHLYYDDTDIKQKLAESLNLPVSLNTVKARTQVAIQFCNTARVQLEFCDAMVHEQHVQQQGWSAVVANLEDIICGFKKKWNLFLKVYGEFMNEKEIYDEVLQHFQNDKELLQRIPVIDVLLETQHEPLECSKMSESNSASQDNDTTKEISLYEWICNSDTKNSLEDLHEVCKTKLQKFKYDIMPSLQHHVTETLQSAEKPERKEIEGLGKRLFDLQELLRKIKKYVDHQADMAKAFQMNQTSASQTNDLSILPDLCATHVRQLEYIKDHHVRLMDDRNRIVRAKYELSKTLCARLDWVQHIENKLWDLDTHLVYFHEHFQRLRKHIEIFQQVHLTPTTYLNAIVEVVRRRAFSQLFLLWASNLACQQLIIYNEELTRRKEFNSTFDGHFLNSLFPGMNDFPPPFATEAPLSFDAKLPGITEEDVDRLKKELPDFAESLTLPDMDHVYNFFLGKTGSTLKEQEKDKVDDAKAVEEKLIQAVSEVGLASNLDKNLLKATGSEPCLITAPGLPILKDDKGCESETDTEEFEKVGQSPLELTFPQGVHAEAPAPKLTEKQDASTSTEDNLQISRSEYEKVKGVLSNFGSLVNKDVKDLRCDLLELKKQFLSYTRDFLESYSDLGGSVNNLVSETAKTQNEITDFMLKQQETERDSFRYNLIEKEEQIRSLQRNMEAMERKHEEVVQEMTLLEEKMARTTSEYDMGIEKLTKQVQDKDLEREKAVKEATELLKHAHKLEIDNIKSRFRLITMEKSPSLTSLEKSGDFASLSGNTTLLAQMQDNFELDKERAVADEKKRCENLFEEKIKELEERFKEEKDILSHDVVKRVTEDKDKQIDILRERERNLNLEIIKYKTTIQQLAEYEQERADSRTVEECELLKKENQELKEELQKIKSERETLMATSVAVYEEKLDACTSNPTQSDLSKSEIALSQRSYRFSIDTCKPGDIVLVLWDSSHENFRILQESKHAYFLHSDSLEHLTLTVTDKTPNKIFCTGTVVDKEYCHARKNENRYKVPKGTKFFRVKVKPVSNLHREQSQSFYQPRHSTCMSTSQSTISTFDPVMEESHVVAVVSDTKQDAKAAGQLGGSCEESQCDDATTTTLAPSNCDGGPVEMLDQPIEIKPQSEQQNFAEDSGIVDSVEQATAATEDSDKHEGDERCVACNAVEVEANISTNWLEAMFRSMFGKNSE